MPELHELGLVMDGAKLRALLPYLEEAVRAQEARLEMQVERAMAEGPLDPQLAVQFWVEKVVLRRVLRSFEQKMAVGASVGAEIGSEMTLSPPPGASK